MRQRVAIAVALACSPRLLIADEPTTALDVTVQAGILRLLDRLRREEGVSIMVITHDLGVLSALADRLVVMYAGRIAETGTTADVLGHPRHPYTRGLLHALPHPELGAAELRPIPGSPPALADRPPGLSVRAALLGVRAVVRRAPARAVADRRRAGHCLPGRPLCPGTGEAT